MRILLACPYAWEAPGGVQTHVRQLAGTLADRGHEVLVIAPGRRAPVEPWVRIVGRPIAVPYGGTVAPICFSRVSWRRVREVMWWFEPELVHAHEPLTPSTSMLAVEAAQVPVVATFHAYLHRSRLLSAAAPALRRVWRRIRVRVAVSAAAASFVARAFPGDVEIVPNGVAVEPFEQARAAEGLPEGRRLLWVNRLDRQKAFPVAVRAFDLLARELPDLSFVVAGEGRDRAAVDRLQATVRRRVVMLGTVAHTDLPPYFAACDAFVSSATGQESFGMVLVEAMAAGLPVVATDVPGYREVVRDGIEGLLVPPGDPVALASAVARILGDRRLAERLADAGRARASEYSWERIVPRLEALYLVATGA